MLEKVLIIALFTMLIHAADTLSYSVRLAGVRTGKLAVSLSLTGIIVLVSRTANLVQGPMTGKVIDYAKEHADFDLSGHFRILIASATVGTIVAMLLFPTFVALFSRVIDHLEVAGSIPQLVKSSVTIEKLKHVRTHIRFPRWEMLSRLRVGGLPKRLLLMNGLVTSIYTIGVLAALYASFLIPQYSTAATLSSGLINGVATIIFAILIDPQVALVTDKAIRGEAEPSVMNKMFGLLMLSRLAGTLIAQLLFLPAAYWIKWIVPLW